MGRCRSYGLPAVPIWRCWAICQAVRLRGLVPIMIDWSDLGQGRNGLFAAVCYRRRGLPLLSWVSWPEELDSSQNRMEEFLLRRLLCHLERWGPERAERMVRCRYAAESHS